MKKKYLLFLIPLLFIQKVNASELVDWAIAGFQSSDNHIKSTYYDANESNRYGPNHFTFNGNGEFFVKLTTCSTGNWAITSVTNTSGTTFFSGRHQGGKCNVQGYEGYIQEYYWTVKQTTDAGSGKRSCIFYFNSQSVSYYSLTDFLGVYIADTIPQSIELPNYSAEFGEVNYRIGNVQTTQAQIQQKQNEIMQEQQAIKQEQQRTTDAVKDVDNTLKDDDVDVEENGSFFSDFDTEDNGGISSIITAPLVAIQEMLNNQCSPLTATYKGKEMSLPCGTSFWAGLGGIKTFLNVAIGGLLCYRIIVKLFKLIEGFKDPENDKVEVMNL